MIPTIRARFACGCPLINLTKRTIMFDTLILQYLDELIEGKIGDLTAPKAFHTIKIQRFKDDRIKPFTKICRKLPVEIFTLIRDLPIQMRYRSHSTPPVIRTFDFTAQCLIEFAKLSQGLFQRLGVLLLFTRAQGQVRFHTEVCPNSLTCCWQGFGIRKISYDIKPIVSAGITLYCYSSDTALPFTVLKEPINHMVISPFTILPFSKVQRDMIVFEVPTRMTWKGNRLKSMSPLDMRSATEFLEKPIIRKVDTFQLLLDRLTRQCFPMWVRCSFQLLKVRAHRSIVRIRQPVLITLTLPLMEIRMHLPHIVQQVTKTYRIRLITKLIFIGSHGVSSIKSLPPIKWVGPTRNLAVTLDLPANLILQLYILHF